MNRKWTAAVIKHKKCFLTCFDCHYCQTSRSVTMKPLALLLSLLLALLPHSTLPAPTAEPEPTSIVVDLLPLALGTGLLLKGIKTLGLSTWQLTFHRLGIFVGNSIAHYNDRKEKRRNTRKTTVTPSLGGPLVNLAQIYQYPSPYRYHYRPPLGV